MYLKIKDIAFTNANALSCPYTLGLSLTAIHGFLINLEFQLNTRKNQDIEIKSFTVVVNSVEEKRRDNLVRDAAYSKGGNLASMLPLRNFHGDLDIICEIEETENLNKDVVMEVLMASKLQGGIIQNLSVEIFNVSNIKEVIAESNLFSRIILNKQDEIIHSEDILDTISEKLLDSNYTLISNGYISIQESSFKRLVSNNDESEDYMANSMFVEPNLILAKYESIKDFLATENKGFQFFQAETDEHYILTTN